VILPDMTAAAPKIPFRLRDALFDILRVIGYNTAIAAFLSAITNNGFLENLLYSQAIGLSIASAMTGSCLLRGVTRPTFVDAVAGIPIGFAIGFSGATWLSGRTLETMISTHSRAALMSATSAAVFGIIAAYYFYNKMRFDDLREEARMERLQRAEQASLAATAELRMLTAQIEPHFLFNTLSVVIELIDSRPAGARSMLLNLVALLRASMANMRRESVPLAAELDLLRAHLGIMGERMGERLSWHIEADDGAEHISLPPLLVQPLVENAIRHGLEPQPQGGHLTICCTLKDDRLVITVADDGTGMGAQTKGGGVGLANIRERLANRYGADAKLELLPQERGMLARLELPACAS
jgi:sensor histidine kinase YesM